MIRIRVYPSWPVFNTLEFNRAVLCKAKKDKGVLLDCCMLKSSRAPKSVEVISFGDITDGEHGTFDCTKSEKS